MHHPAIQYISDQKGEVTGVIVPIDLWRHLHLDEEREDPLSQMKEAVNDPLFMQDLHETMAAFAATDAESWEQET